MSFLNPLAFFALISIPAILIMYLLKQKQKEIEISSIMLWKKVETMALSHRPWQKLRRNLLMFLQILIAFFIVTAMANPYINSKGQRVSIILVLDASLTMQAVDERPNRFEAAKRELDNFIDSLPPGSVISLVSAAGDSSAAAGFSTDKNYIKSKIKSLEVTNEQLNVEALQNICEMLLEQQQSHVYVFTDKILFDGKDNYSISLVGQSIANVAVTLISHVVESDRTVVLVKLRNFSSESSARNVSLYADGRLHDMKEVEIKAESEKDIFFTDVSAQARRLVAKASVVGDSSTSDFLEIDDMRYAVINDNAQQRVALVSDGNIFLEKILTLMPEIELIKVPKAEADNLRGYFIYIFDGVLPEKVPSDGHMLLINPPESNLFIETGVEIEVKEIYTVTDTDTQLLQFINGFQFAVSKAKKIITPEWAKKILSTDDTDLIFSGETNGRKVMVFSFDLHNSDLPLKKEFPIFMYNLISSFSPGTTLNSENILTGSTVSFTPFPNALKINVASPDNELTVLAPPFPALNFSRASVPGFYVYQQENPNDTVYFDFAVNVPTGDSDLRRTEETSNVSSGGPISANINELNAAKLNIQKIILVLVIALLIAELCISFHKYGFTGLSKKSRRTIFVCMRSFVFILLALALIGVKINYKSDIMMTVFAIDRSESMNVLNQKVHNFLNSTVGSRGNKDMVGVISFGEKAIVEYLPNAGNPNFETRGHFPYSGYTNIENSLRLAKTIMQDGAKKRIVLVSDGLENIGDAASFCKELRESGIVVDIFPIEENIGAEVQLNSIKLPSNMNLGMQFDIEITAYATSENLGKLMIYRNDTLISDETVDIRKGENKFVMTETAESSGGVVYRAEILPVADKYTGNNLVYSYCFIAGNPKILAIGHDDSEKEIVRLLNASDVDVTIRSAAELSSDILQLNSFDAVILSDINLEECPNGFDSLLETYVKDFGGGLIVSGGSNSYGLGGYDNTCLEKILPVDMQIKNEEEKPNLGMILVLDRSGSMGDGKYGVSKLELAKEAGIRTIERLNEQDCFGVITFDTEFEWSSPFRQVSRQKDVIGKEISGITLGGGTSILTGLNAAYDTLKNADTKLKHIILLTDGQSERDGYDSLLNAMNLDGITLSTIAVGSDSDTELLETLAELGNGRYYFTNEFTDLPQIFVKETKFASRNYLNNEPFYPELGDYNEVLSGVERLPQLFGYISTTAKPRADVCLISGRNEPILAVWQYGIGRSVAWTSDMSGHWSSEWLNYNESATVFRNMISWAIRKPVSSEFNISTTSVGKDNEIIVTMPFAENIDGLSAAFYSPNGSIADFHADFEALAPGSYRMLLKDFREGAYLVNIEVKTGEASKNVPMGFGVKYSPELGVKNREHGIELLKTIAKQTGGRILRQADDVFAELESKVIHKIDISDLLLLFSLILFLLDIAVRRFSTGKFSLRIFGFSFIAKGSKRAEIAGEHSKITESEEAKQSVSAMLVSRKNKRMGR